MITLIQIGIIIILLPVVLKAALIGIVTLVCFIAMIVLLLIGLIIKIWW